jgi:CDP-paratose 2-epimerase
LAHLPVKSANDSFRLQQNSIKGLSELGISETFPTSAPISLYGASKLASEQLILEYGYNYDFPVWINRCGVLAGAGQFGKADQGVFSYWIHSFKEKNPLKYIGFDGSGHQVRDALHPRDLVPLLSHQLMEPNWDAPKIINVGGGIENSISLKQLSDWCEKRFGANEVISSSESRPMDAPWIVMDSTIAENAWNWSVKTKLDQILDETAGHADQNPNWLSFSK